MAPADIAPLHATIGFGISNTVANVPGFVAPSLVRSEQPQNSKKFIWVLLGWLPSD